MIIYAATATERLSYVLRIVFNSILNQEFKLVVNTNDISEGDKFVISYTEIPIKNTFHIYPFGLLSEQGIRKHDVPTGNFENLTTLFHTGKGDIPFDIFSAIFYTISRYEEYLPFEGDEHGRFQAANSIAFKNGFHRLPILELWCKLFAEKIGITFPKKQFEFKLTFDIDSAWKHLNKGFWRSLGGFAKLLLTAKWNELSEKSGVIAGKIPDAFYTFDYLKSIDFKLKVPIQYFILCKGRGKYDVAISLRNTEFRKLLSKLEERVSLGLHPSYKSFTSVKELEKEYCELSDIADREIQKSRQHFLLLKFPDTYRNLMKLGICEDYTLGWSSHTGFRAGISRSFPFYDLLAEQETTLMLVPFVAMDRTLQKYMSLKPEEGLAELKELADITKSVGGEFVMLWHNDSVSDSGEWKGWREVLEQIIEYAG